MEKEAKKKEKDVVVYEKDLDMAGASRGVWLVKVPKYISSRWEKCPGNIAAGQLNITKYIVCLLLPSRRSSLLFIVVISPYCIA